MKPRAIMPRSGQEVVYEGWLTKSPPTKRIWRARWRRRWFSLQNSGELPGQYFLTYYTDRKCRKLKGTINLDHCEQVDTGLKFEDSKYKFDFMFDIKTPTRTYYLAADTEEEMKAWASCICNICGLKATTDDDAVTRSLSPPSTIYEDKQKEPLRDDASKNVIDSPPVSPVSSGPYIPISECITGRFSGQGVQDFYTLLQHNIKNSYFKSDMTKGHSNDTYDTAPPTYLNDINSELDPRFYDCPRSHHPPLQKTYKNAEMYSNMIKSEKNINGSPLQSPTDSESVFTDEDWAHNVSTDNVAKSVNPSNSSMTEPLLSDSLSKIILDDLSKQLDPPPRPPKPAIVAPAPNYFNLSQTPVASKKCGGKETDTNQTDDVAPNVGIQSQIVISDEMYDFPRSHQLEGGDSVPNTLIRRHCYNNAAPVKIEGQIFRYDISPRLSTSSTGPHVFQYDNLDAQDEPASPVSQGSSSTAAAYSNLPSPALLSDTQLMPPPQINRSLKPKRKLSDSLSISSNAEPSSPRPAPSVDRSCKPVIISQGSSLRKAFESEAEYNRRIRAAPSPTPPQDNLYGNQQMYSFYSDAKSRRRKGDLSSVQYLDLDHSVSQYGTTTSKPQPLRSPGASTVYKQVDFMKTKAFNMTKQNLEEERKEPLSFKK